MDAPKDRRTAALENLLHLLLTTDGSAMAGKEMTVCVSECNSVTVNFKNPPSKSEVDVLIKHLELMKTQRPQTAKRATIDAINEILVKAELAPIEETPVDDAIRGPTRDQLMGRR